jgi:hypothetical protein
MNGFSARYTSKLFPFIPNVIGRQALWVIGKIRLRPAALGAPVAAKRGVVNSSTRLKISLYLSSALYNKTVDPRNTLPDG